MTPDLSCYGADIPALADLVGDFDLRSPVDTRAWYTAEWTAVADLLGFSQQLAAELGRRRGAHDWVAASSEAGTAAFAVWLRQRRPGVTPAHAAVQSSVLAELAAAGRARGELWRVEVDPTTLESGACHDDAGGSSRAFYPDTAPGYFGEGWPGPPPRTASRCGWQTPLVLHLGTFPWVYSSRLDVTGPGLRWASAESFPALAAFRVMASFLAPEANLLQDARQVAAIYRHFATHTAPLLARVAGARAGTTTEVGRLYRRGGFLHVHQGSLHVAGLDGPRGRLPAVAYNYILRRFASFFAVRRAVVRALYWVPEMRHLATASSDPCLRAQVEGVARAG